MTRGRRSVSVITDVLLDPFFISSDRDGYAVLEKSNKLLRDSKISLDEYKQPGNYSVIGYYKTLNECLLKIYKQHLQLGNNFENLKEVITLLDKSEEKMKQFIKKYNS